MHLMKFLASNHLMRRLSNNITIRDPLETLKNDSTSNLIVSWQSTQKKTLIT